MPAQDFAQPLSRKRDVLATARAYQRMFLTEKGELHADGHVVLGDLLRRTDFFGPQYDLDNPNRTYIRAAQRELLIHFFAMLGLSEAYILRQREILTDD